MIQVTFHVAIFIDESRIILLSSISSQTSNFRANPWLLEIEWSGIRLGTDYRKSGLSLNPKRRQRKGGDGETSHLKEDKKGLEDSIGPNQNIWGSALQWISKMF